MCFNAKEQTSAKYVVWALVSHRYILTPPCLWGADPALEPMPLASSIPFMVRAIANSNANSTDGQHGEMAFPEATLVSWKNTSAFAKHP